MHLLISDITAIDAVFDRALPWAGNLTDTLALQSPDTGPLDDHEPEIVGRKHPWYEPRLSALRRLIAEQQSWETR